MAPTAAPGRSRGNFGTSVHAAVGTPGNYLHLALPSAGCADRPQRLALLAGLAQPPGALASPKVYDIHYIKASGAIATQQWELVIHVLQKNAREVLTGGLAQEGRFFR